MTIEQIIGLLPRELGIALLLIVAFGIGFKQVQLYIEAQLAKQDVKTNDKMKLLEERIKALEGRQSEAHKLALEGLTIKANAEGYAGESQKLFKKICEVLG